MKIRENDGTEVNIFGIYFMDGKTMFYGIPMNYGGLMAFRFSDVTVIDESITGRFVFYDEGIFHWALIEKELLGDLVELDEDAYKKFVGILKSEGQLEEGFY